MLSVQSANDIESIRNCTGAQYVRIEVRVQSGRGAARVFHIRLNSLDYSTLRDRLIRPINNARAVLVHSSMAERFVDVFLKQIDLNPPYVMPQNMVRCSSYVPSV